jgi:hypothetical protein
MIHMVNSVRYISGVRRGLVSFSELDSHRYELWIRCGSIEVF